ncbi:replicative DNA helicase [Fictibacillus sp. JL2B1089]|uniref:replicative DNA helicase n=1 Tax=Fictibacillus sp. JL2B1089 TaxID=3399565 RepID=UPI003A8989E7
MNDMLANIEAEQAVLGSILLEPDLIQECQMSIEHFGTTSHKQIFRAMREVDSNGNEVDFVTVLAELGDAAEQVGGLTYLTQLPESVPSTATFHHYEQLMLEAYRLREARKIANVLAQEPTEENITKAYNDLASIQEIGIKPQRTKMDLLMEIYEDVSTPKGDLTGINTGLSELNEMTGGLQNGDLIIVAARPSMGKTAFALNLAIHNSHKGGVTEIFSLEMSDKQLANRMLSAIGRIEGSKWRNPHKKFTDTDHENFHKAMGIYSNYNMNIYDKPGQTLFDIRVAVKKSRKDNPGKQQLVIIDYLQLIKVVGKFDRHDLAIGHITRELKSMAREFNIPIILLSQLSRSVEQRQDKRPMMSDIRDSGSVEQDADLIAFLYRDDYYNKKSEAKNIVEVIVAKHRNGPTGTLEFLFVKEFGQFLDLSRQMELV